MLSSFTFPIGSEKNKSAQHLLTLPSVVIVNCVKGNSQNPRGDFDFIFLFGEVPARLDLTILAWDLLTLNLKMFLLIWKK